LRFSKKEHKKLYNKTYPMSIRQVIIPLIVVISSPLYALATFAQTTRDSLPKVDDFFAQWVSYSRPGKYHKLLAGLAGSWTFKGKHYSGDPNPDSNKVEVAFTGTMERKPFANGRYFIAEFHGSKIQMPIQDGKMQEVNSTEIETEGYDNIKGKFVKTRIGNHLGSDISYSEGNYDSTKKTIIYFRVEVLIPGVSMRTYEHVKMLDNDHYLIRIYRERENKIIKDTEINYTRAGLK
jgi:hypothetical protein